MTLPAAGVLGEPQEILIPARSSGTGLAHAASPAKVINVAGPEILRVRDVAEVVDGYQDVSRLVQIDGQPMVRLGVRKQSGANTVTVAKAVLEGLTFELRQNIDLLRDAGVPIGELHAVGGGARSDASLAVSP